VQEVSFEEVVGGVFVFDAAPAALEMIDLVATRILQLSWQTGRDPILVYIASQYPRIS
jgi:hypothetical protein